MSMMRFVVPVETSTVGEDQVAVVMSTSALARDGHILLPQGCRLGDYLRNPIVLWQHSPDEPIGNAENITITRDSISARIRFAPLGISRKADEIRGLMKAGVVRAVSVSFDPIEMEPLDRNKPRGGQRISVWTLLELSAVSVGADTNALVTARALREGKSLSGANAAALQEAHNHAERCLSTIAGVLNGAGAGPSGGGAPTLEQRRRQLAVRLLAHPPESDLERRKRELAALEGHAPRYSLAERQAAVALRATKQGRAVPQEQSQRAQEMHRFLIAANGGSDQHERQLAVRRRTK